MNIMLTIYVDKHCCSGIKIKMYYLFVKSTYIHRNIKLFQNIIVTIHMNNVLNRHTAYII